MHLFFRRLHTRVLIVIIVVQTAVSGIIAPWVIWRVERTGRDLTHDQLARSAALLAETVAEPLRTHDLARLQRLLERTLSYGFRSIQVRDEYGALVIDAQAPTDPALPAPPSTPQMVSPVIVAGRRIGSIRLAPTATVLAESRANAWWIGAWLIGWQTLGVALMAGLLMRPAIRMRRLRNAALAAAGGDLSARAPEGGVDDVAELARALNTLIGAAQQPRPGGAAPGGAAGVTEAGDGEAGRHELVELIPDAVCVCAANRLRYVNQAAVAVLRAGAKSDLLDRPLLDFVHPGSKEAVRRQVAEARRAPGRMTTTRERFVGLDGAELHVALSTSRIRFGGESAVLVLFRDVSREHEAEEALWRSEQLLRTVVQNAPLVLYAMDAEGRFLLSEGRDLALLGRQPGEVVGLLADEVFAHLPDRLAMLHRALAGEAFTAEVDVDGVIFDSYHQPIFDERGRPAGVIVVSVNTTERRQAEAELRQAQKMEGLGQLTGGVAHDFNNLLTVVLGNLALLRRSFAGEPRAAEYIAQAIEAAERGSQLTQRLLAFSRKQALRPASVDVNRLVTSMADLLRPMLGETVELETVLAGGLWPALVDPGQLESTLLNLAVNARDAMPDGGKLTIETANARLDAEYAATHEEVKAGQYVMIAVSDTGTGMSPGVMRSAFEPFFTTKEVGKGSGLGLSMIFGFVKQSAGHVKLYSEPGEGTTVKVYLPRATGPAQPRRAAGPTLSSLQGAGEKVLVVEDDESVRELAVAILASLNYQPIAASDGPSALALLDGHEDVAILFTDVVLPGGMSGAELAREAIERRPGLKVLYTSGYTENAIIHHGRLDEHVELLEKPFRIESLARKVRDLLDDED